MIKGSLTDGIGYEGKVRVLLESNGSRKEFIGYNKGQKALWNLLAKAVVGYDVKQEIPRYLDVVNYNFDKPDDPEQYNSCLCRKVPFTSIVWGDLIPEFDNDNRTAVRLTATVTVAEKVSTLNVDNCALVMYNYNDVLAVIKDDQKVLAEIMNHITVGVNAVIEWTLLFSNLPLETGDK